MYRIPGRNELSLAVGREYLPHQEEEIFWMAPFVHQSSAQNIYLSVVKPETVNEDFLQKISFEPSQPEIAISLPRETRKEAYFKEINAYLRDIRDGKLQKAILSRVFHIEKPTGFDPVETFVRFTQDYPDTFVHLSLHPSSGMWMGASPELLLRKRGKNLFTTALAGTQGRKVRGEYHWRPKEMEEHRMLWAHTEKVFEANGCRLLKREGPNTIESGQVAHLSTDYIFEETSDVNIRKLLMELHPTPAVGGLPVDKGIDCILEHEGYDRKYYCGFIGQTDFLHTADFFVNLRCMQIANTHIAIYVGGGITAASDPQEEWQETIMKSKTMVEKIQPVKELN